MIRADLVYKCGREELPGYNWKGLDGVRNISDGKADFALRCRIKDPPAGLIQCGVKEPLNYRLRLKCQEASPFFENKASGPFFQVTFLGHYAVNLGALEPHKGDFLVLTNPSIYLKRPPRRKNESRYEVFVGNEPLCPSRKVILIQGGPGSTVDKRGTADDSVFNPNQFVRVYTPLKDCVSTDKGVEYNTWAVVTKVRRDPSPTSKKMMIAMVFIIDETYTGSYGFSDFQFSILSNDLDDFPPLRVGSVIRIHNLLMSEWHGHINGRVFDAGLVTVVRFDENGECSPICRSRRFVWTEKDKQRAMELNEWWNKTLDVSERNSITSKTLEIRDVIGYCRFDLYCCIVNTFVEDSNSFVLRVMDGTPSSIKSISLTFEDNSLCFKPKERKYDIDIFVEGRNSIYDGLANYDNILLTRILCKRVESCTGGEPVFQFVVEKNSSSTCTKLDSSNAEVAVMLKNIELSNREQFLNIVNSEDVGLNILDNSPSVTAGGRKDDCVLLTQSSEVSSQNHHSVSSNSKSTKTSVPTDKNLHEEHVGSRSEENIYSTPPESISGIFNSTSLQRRTTKDEFISIQDINKSTNKPFGRFVTVGTIRSIYPLRPEELIVTICERCKSPGPIRNFDRSLECSNCRSMLRTCFNFIIVLQEGLDSIEVFVTGYNAELFLGLTSEKVIADRRTQNEIVRKLQLFVINRKVEIIVAYLNYSEDKEFYAVERPRFLD